MGWDGVERRNKKRYGIKSSVVRYKRGLLPLLGGQSDPLLLLNVSQGGCHFMSREPLELEQKLALKIEAPQLSSPLHARGRVAWIRPSEQAKQMYRVGVEFTQLSAGARKILKDLLDSAVLDNVEVSTRVYVKELEKL